MEYEKTEKSGSRCAESSNRPEWTNGGSLLAEPKIDSLLHRSGEASDLFQKDSVEYFTSFVQIFGLPKSIGQIYGVLFATVDPIPMDEVISRLQISKGSASQGLSLLRELGAVTVHQVPNDRRDHFAADLNVSRIVRHFFENRLEDRLSNAEMRIEQMLTLARSADDAKEDGDNRLTTRVKSLQKWNKRGKKMLPLIVGWLKR